MRREMRYDGLPTLRPPPQSPAVPQEPRWRGCRGFVQPYRIVVSHAGAPATDAIWLGGRDTFHEPQRAAQPDRAASLAQSGGRGQGQGHPRSPRSLAPPTTGGPGTWPVRNCAPGLAASRNGTASRANNEADVQEEKRTLGGASLLMSGCQ